jgi:M6 family metalloprotease-like protein
VQNRVFISFILIPLFLTQAGAVPHINPDAYPNAKPCHVRSFTQAQIRAAGSYKNALITNANGPKKIAVIFVRFSGAGSTTSGSPTISNPGNFLNDFNLFSQYFTEVSYGKLGLTFYYFGDGTAAETGAGTPAAAGSYQVSQKMEYYGCGDVDNGCPTVSPVSEPRQGGAELIGEAIALARVGRTTFDSAHYDAILVMHAGYGNESTTNKNGDIWSAFYQDDANSHFINNAGGGFIDGATFPEFEYGLAGPVGVMCHEFGHYLALPDLYNTQYYGGASVVGQWDLMDGGEYLPQTGPNSGQNPAHMGAWDKQALGWAEPQIASMRGSFSLSPAETTLVSGTASTNFVRIPVQNGTGSEYFMVEYRSKTAGNFDQYIPGSGIMIWHIDDNIAITRGITNPNPAVANTVNTGSPHYGVSIVTADGIILSNTNRGNAGNLYHQGSVFISPKSDNFAHTPSGVNVVNIGAIGPTVPFDVVNLQVTSNQAIHSLISYPNPAGKGYPHPQGEGNATITFKLSRPASDLQLNLYTLSGDLVRKVGMSDIPLNITRSTDLEWVYEYVWDLKNGDGAMVAPGVYLYFVRADGTSQSNKAVIIR